MNLVRNILKTVRVGIVAGTLFGIGLVGVSFALYFITQIFLDQWEFVALPPLWFLGYIGAGIAANLQTKRVAAGVVAGVWGGFVTMTLVLIVIDLESGRLVSLFRGSDPMTQYEFLIACTCIVGAVAGTVGSTSAHFYGRSRREELQNTLRERSSEDIYMNS